MERIVSFFWPIKRWEQKKFFPMAFMLFFTIFNYNTLKALKDGLIVPTLGAEAVTFVKSYGVIPAAILFVLLYMKMSDSLKFKKIYLYIASFYVIFFLVFAFILYPYQSYIHPSVESIRVMLEGDLNLGLFSISASHFKWFLLIYGKWLYVIFYILSELWGSSMIFVLFWQFSNQIVPSNQAKRFYPMINLVGSFGTFISGVVIQYISKIQFGMPKDLDAVFSVQTLLFILIASTLSILMLFWYMNNRVLSDVKYAQDIKPQKIKKKMPISESLKVILSSKYLGHIVVLVVSYGITINLLEGPWKDKARSLYQDTGSYIDFMGTINQWIGAAAVVFSLVGVRVLKRYSWFTAAIIAPVIIFTTGIAFFAFIVFDNTLTLIISSFIVTNPLLVPVALGSMQNVLSKSVKFGLFDPSKEMTYIPIEEELRSKGKAAVDVIGARVSKSGAAFLQTIIFMLFPAATYSNIAPFLMILFTVVAIIWIINVRCLNKEYLKYLSLVKEK